MTIRSYRFTPTVLALAVAAAAAPWARAQEEGTRAAALEEVIVTAERREASLQETPISVLAFGIDSLEKLGVDDLGDIQHSVPNLVMRQFPNSQASLRTYMRGVGNNDVGMSTDPSVGVYIDGIYVARSIGLGSEVASLERIEVLRGPQGSLYGRNTIGGAINMITAKPKGEWGVKGGLSAGDSAQNRGSSPVSGPGGRRLPPARIGWQWPSPRDPRRPSSGPARRAGGPHRRRRRFPWNATAQTAAAAAPSSRTKWFRISSCKGADDAPAPERGG